jgi:hypothetical protein
MKTRPRDSGSESGGSTISLGGASFLIAISGDEPMMSLALGERGKLQDCCFGKGVNVFSIGIFYSHKSGKDELQS